MKGRKPMSKWKKYVLAFLLMLTCSISQAAEITGYKIIVWNPRTQNYADVHVEKGEDATFTKTHEVAKQFAETQDKFSGKNVIVPTKSFAIIPMLKLGPNEVLPTWKPYTNPPSNVYISIRTVNNSHIIVPTKATNVWQAYNNVTVDDGKLVVVAGKDKIVLDADLVMSCSFQVIRRAQFLERRKK